MLEASTFIRVTGMPSTPLCSPPAPETVGPSLRPHPPPESCPQLRPSHSSPEGPGLGGAGCSLAGCPTELEQLPPPMLSALAAEMEKNGCVSQGSPARRGKGSPVLVTFLALVSA